PVSGADAVTGGLSWGLGLAKNTKTSFQCHCLHIIIIRENNGNTSSGDKSGNHEQRSGRPQPLHHFAQGRHLDGSSAVARRLPITPLPAPAGRRRQRPPGGGAATGTRGGRSRT